MLRYLPAAILRRLSKLQPAASALVWLSCVSIVVFALGVSQRRHATPLHPQTLAQTLPSPQSIQSRTGGFVPTEDSWNEQLRDPAFWKNRKNGGGGNLNFAAARPSGLTRAAPVSLPPLDGAWGETSRFKGKSGKSRDDDDGDSKPAANTYRTMCVRLCDGFYWPVSFATTKDKFDDDASTCARSCGGAATAKLFVYRNPGSDIDAMEDLNGRAYKKLETAFSFRAKYEPSCKCRPHPWEDASLQRHQSYALAASARKGDQIAFQQLKDLRAKTASDARDAKIQDAKSKNDKAAGRAVDKKFAILKSATEPAAAAVSAAKPTAAAKKNLRVTEAPRKPNGPRQLRIITRDDDDDDDDRPQSKIVIMRYGNQPPASVNVPASRRNRRAADASSTTYQRQ